MSVYLFSISRIVASILVLINLISVYKHGFSYREVMLLITLILFLIGSRLYEIKKGIFGPGYLIYFIVVFIIQNVSPYAYIYRYSNYYTLVTNSNARVPNDNYTIYFIVFCIINLSIIMYLLLSKNQINKSENLQVILNIREAGIVLFVTIVFLAPLNFLLGGIFRTIFITAITYFFVSYLFIKESRKNMIYIIGLILSILIMFFLFESRYVVVRYMIPIGLSFILLNYMKNGPKPKLKIKTKLMVIIGFISILFYGVISEVIKLNSRKGISTSFMDISNIIYDITTLLEGIDRQIYRIFEIWTVLGGNIIDFVNINGFFYGITYIKSLAPIIGFDYVSLPELSASMVGANYAQPGLVAEGYANFGIIGAVLNVLLLFFLAETFQHRFIKKKTMFNLLLTTVPFSSVILDGGTINAALFNVIFLIITFSLSFILLKKRSRYVSLKS